MNTIKKIILSILGVGFASAAGYEAITPADTTMSKVAVAYEQSEPLKSKYALTNSQFVKAGADKNKVKAELGEAGSKDFEPSLTFSRWNGEAKFKIKPDISKVAKKDKKLELDGEKIKYKAGKIDYVFYDKPEASEDGGFEWEIVLNKKTATNTWSEAIESTGVEFYKQKPLNEEQQEEGTTCTATECVDAEGNITASRPEDIVDSIAVYGTGKSGNFTAMGGMNYMAGKVGQIYRIKAIDANGDWTWCDQNIAGGIWTKTCPQSFLDSAAYPVVVDPTFGYTTKGSSSGLQIGSNGAGGTTMNNSCSLTGYVDSISVATALYTQNFKGFITDSSFNILTNGVSPAGTSNPGNWVTIDYVNKPAVNSGSTYTPWIVANGTINFYYDSGGGTYPYMYENDNNYTNPTKPAGLSGSDYKFSIYATYETGEGAARRVIITE